MKNASEEDIVFIYFSGHGTLIQEKYTVLKEGKKNIEFRKRSNIITSNTRQGKVSDSAVPLEKVIDWFEKLKSRRKVLILDMCHSGIGKSQLSPDQAEIINTAKGINFVPMEDSWASIILSACPIGGTSYEDETLGNSVYTHFLLEGMNKGDLNKEGGITISDGHNYAIERTRQYTWEKKDINRFPQLFPKFWAKIPFW